MRTSQRTLRATIEWSYDLLDATSKELFARLAVFTGSFPLEAAEEVCGADLDALAALVDSSLLKPMGDDRFLMLETIREYALERLATSDEANEVRRRHASFFLALAERSYEHRFDAEAKWSARLEFDHDDFRAALDWLFENDRDRTLELAGALGWFWMSHGFLAEGRGRLAGAIAGSAATGRPRARALTASGCLVARHGEVDEGRVQVEEGIALWRDLGEQDELASALDLLGWLLVYDAGDDSGSLEAFEQSALVGVCQVLVALGKVERGEALSSDLLARGEDDARTRHFAIHFLADCSLIRGDCAEAEDRYRESLLAALELGDVVETSIEVQGIAMAKAGQGEWARALELAASVEALWRSLGTDLHVAFWDRLLERYLAEARVALGTDVDAAHARGLELPFDEAVALALQDGALESRA